VKQNFSAFQNELFLAQQQLTSSIAMVGTSLIMTRRRALAKLASQSRMMNLIVLFVS
jgi:hypothetical protein